MVVTRFEISKKGVAFIVPFEFKIFIFPPFSTTKSLESPAFTISNGWVKPVAKDCNCIVCAFPNNAKNKILKSYLIGGIFFCQF